MPKGHNAKGRSKGSSRFIALQHHLLDTEAGRSLNPRELAVLIRIMYRYNGENNGLLALSARDAAKEARMNKDTACAVLHRLVDKGFIKCTTPSSFGTNSRKAPEWELTCFPSGKNKPASREYQHWRAANKKNPSSQNRDTTVPKQGHKPKLRLVK